MEFKSAVWSNLPLEMWDQIISHLSIEDLVNYCLVNKTWNLICTPYLYNTIYLEDLTDDYIPFICLSPHQLGRFVKRIKFMEGSYDLEELYERLTMLIDYCPNVEVFESDDENMSYGWWKTFLRIMQEGHIWTKLQRIPDTIRESDNLELYYQCVREVRSSLTNLQLLGPRSTPVRIENVAELRLFPCLTRLNIFPRIGYATKQDYELALRYASQVAELDIDWHDFGLTQTELDTLEALQNIPQTVEAYPSMKKVSINGCFSFDAIYMPQISYFLQKFPCLQELQVTIHSSAVFDIQSIEHMTRIPFIILKVRYISALLQLLNSLIKFQHPRTIQLEYTPEFHYLRQIVVQLTMTSDGIHCNITGEYEDDFSSSVSSVILNILGPQLHRLIIEHPCHFWSFFNLGIYGDCCPNLKSLQISYIEVDHYLPITNKCHIHLTELKLNKANLSDGVLTEISNFLPNLQKLVMHECHFPNETNLPVTLIMDMPNTRFDKVLELDLISLNFFTAERRLIQTSATSQLKDTRLGIEGNDWLRKIVLKEPAVTAMGGLPLRLKESIEKELKHFKTNGITPIFVFPGLSILRKDKPFSKEDTRPNHRATGWEFYEKGKVDLAMSNWASSGGVHPADLLNSVFHILHENGIEFVRAPYSAWAQLAYMYNHPRQLVNAVCGGSELLMWDVDKMITSIDFEKGNYHWISKKTVLQDLVVSDEQFLDICILAGFEYCPSFPPLNTSVVSFTFKGVHDLIKQHKTGFNAVQAYSDNPIISKTQYIDLFCRTRCAVKYHLILTDEGEIKPLNIEHAPNDIHEFIGYRLPDELYYYLMRGLIGPQCINSLVSGVLIENAPLDNGESAEYHHFLHQLLSIRTQTLSFLTQPLHQFYKTRKVATYFWFEPAVEQIMYHQPTEGATRIDVTPLNTVYEKTNSWNVTKCLIDSELKSQKTTHIDLKFCIRTLENESNATKTITKPHPEQPLEDKNEIIANVLWKTLEIRDFITSSKHLLTPWGKALNTAFKGDQVPRPMQEALLTALELIRFEVLSNKTYSKTYTKPLGNESEQKNIILLSRIFSLLPIQLKSAQWSGPLNRDLLVFNSFVKALNRSYRNLSEMITLSFFLNGLVRKERDDYFGINDSLPYMADVNVALGLVCKHYLERIVEGQPPSEALAHTEKAFPTCSSIQADLDIGFQFWKKLVESMELLHRMNTISLETWTMFTDANEWLRTKRL
ncbi:hypothetical protein G6F46_002736 [Rhizopus delemar]|nr:hypothetical protein G6F49_003524 [Rhizopus delemar]KAG1595458.1 hypothetical protein G6F48_000676 [Rhizopus delemar]KAG1619992.1 hypothetical protein G6F46_002736 [Rhizopus delemar]